MTQTHHNAGSWNLSVPARERAAERQQIANTILAQLGGRRFVAMTGASKLTVADSGLNFVLPSGFATDGINVVRITLTPADDYTIEFIRIGRAPHYKTQIIKTLDMVYCDQLTDVFERTTGLRVSL